MVSANVYVYESITWCRTREKRFDCTGFNPDEGG